MVRASTLRNNFANAREFKFLSEDSLMSAGKLLASFYMHPFGVEVQQSKAMVARAHNTSNIVLFNLFLPIKSKGCT